jgi:hypothetical protein
LAAQEILRHAREIGTVPAGLTRWASELLEPEVDWRRALAAEVRKAVADVTGRLTTPTGGDPAGRRALGTSRCPRSGGRSPRSRSSATPPAA